jgi:hypothetical protein
VVKLSNIVRKEKEFLFAQSSETVAPLAFILNELDNYHEQIKGLNDYSKQMLARAWGIANSNMKGEHDSYLPEFYAGLKETLANSPDSVCKWANAIVEGFKKDDFYMTKVLAGALADGT